MEPFDFDIFRANISQRHSTREKSYVSVILPKQSLTQKIHTFVTSMFVKCVCEREAVLCYCELLKYLCIIDLIAHWPDWQRQHQVHNCQTYIYKYESMPNCVMSWFFVFHFFVVFSFLTSASYLLNVWWFFRCKVLHIFILIKAHGARSK